jgi:hypothetical protein
VLGRTAKWLGTVGLILVALSCKSLPQADGAVGEEVATTQAIPGADVVPLEWGRLVSVTVAPRALSFLWFQDDSGSVRIVKFDHSTKQLQQQATLIRRR